MYRTTNNSPAMSGAFQSYVPYFYQSGLYLTQEMPASSGPQQGHQQTNAQYDFSSDLTGQRAFPRPQTVEQIIARGYLAVPPTESETALISDKKDTSWQALDDVIAQVQERRQLYQQNMYELSYSVCEANNSVFRQEADQGAPADNRQRYGADKMIQELYEQMRVERQRLWQDVSKLRQFLPEAAQSYLSSYRKMAILDDTKGDGL